MTRPTPRPFIHAWRDDQAIADGAAIVQLELQLRKLIRAADAYCTTFGSGHHAAYTALRNAIATAKAHLS